MMMIILMDKKMIMTIIARWQDDVDDQNDNDNADVDDDVDGLA